MDDKLVDILLDSSRQLNENVSKLTTAVNELTVTTRLQQQSTDALVGRMDNLEDWKSHVDNHITHVDSHITSMAPVTMVVSGVRHAVIVAVIASLVGAIGYELARSKDVIPPKTVSLPEPTATVKEK